MKEKKKLIIQILIFILILVLIAYMYNYFIKKQYLNNDLNNNNLNNKEEVEEMEEVNVLTITSENYTQEVEQSDKIVLIDFWASWCGPCKMMSPIIDNVAKQLDGQVKVGKINVDAETELAVKYNIVSIPTLVIIKDGEVVKTFVGVQSKDTIIEALNEELGQ